MTGSSNGTAKISVVQRSTFNCRLLTCRLKTREGCEHQEHHRVKDEAEVVHHVLGGVADALVNHSDADGDEQMDQHAHETHRWVARQQQERPDEQEVELAEERRGVQVAVVAVALWVEDVQLGAELRLLHANTYRVGLNTRRDRQLWLALLHRLTFLSVVLVFAVENLLVQPPNLVAVVVRRNFKQIIGGIERRGADEVKFGEERHQVAARALINAAAFSDGVDQVEHLE